MIEWPSPVVAQDAPASAFARDAYEGLCRPGQKTLAPKYLYDDLGTMLFEAITSLPEYGVWRAECRLLEAHATEIAERCGAGMVVELGSGSANKTRGLLEAQLAHRDVRYCDIDVSRRALELARRQLQDLPRLQVHGFECEYLEGLQQALRMRCAGERVLVLFLGSSLGNFDRGAGMRFLSRLRRSLRAGDALLLGADLEKPEAALLAAYDDPLGVTAAFNLNLLARMNRELGATFALDRFRHRVRYDPVRRDVQMHIESLHDQCVAVHDAGFAVSLRRGETIHTESSHKYSAPELDHLLHGAGFACMARWRDSAWPFEDRLLLAV
jgi:dimethylhistidine N-methyltransferase